MIHCVYVYHKIFFNFLFIMAPCFAMVLIEFQASDVPTPTPASTSTSLHQHPQFSSHPNLFNKHILYLAIVIWVSCLQCCWRHGLDICTDDTTNVHEDSGPYPIIFHPPFLTSLLKFLPSLFVSMY